MTQEPKLNIKKVAEIAGVSVASVSRSLNGKGGISESTRQKVLDTCKALNYNPSLTARKLSSGKDISIAILLSRNDTQLSPYMTLMYSNLLDELNKRGLAPEIVYHEEVDTIKQRACGCIVIDATEGDERLASLKQQQVPYVNVGKKVDGWWVAPDEYMGIRQITLNLVNKGKKRIAFVIARDNNPVEESLRFQGYKSALDSVGLPSKAIIFEGRHFQGMHACSYFFRNPELLDQFDAFVCHSDEIALGVAESISTQNRAIPDDIAITGFDDLPVVSTDLTTVRQDLAHIASKAVECLDLAKTGQEPFGVISPVEVISRLTG
ncbi:LacI family transcriptional regulator [Vibrio sp. Isolate25]|uniref:LacI family DNA-binding transcriptional regulator n=1 Tax=Vibrio TaxID=662 RepID=UPI001EFCBC7B|nr:MULTISPECIES: LacI family DNA-binding transcriptional regulator [Vibrio]MCG9596044.1 LacI family transcriptional regulator [Vibrio sp. Isolate25]MCG9677542.1 LacI family transcriptional regulator [Vibrio sp. Isolate24]USD35064.1 LacI family DNA-binding transcriptional regulator [Vibrio sp. SCSIO 43186]USD48130.1 LacI family DNA-binding transcriptional regulator [Vibrio sp. SCSIO 43145]USD72189.1 LacI family DNA-binding transcriptional regulator [Vibrio sp. SCSIO 43139]